MIGPWESGEDRTMLLELGDRNQAAFDQFIELRDIMRDIGLSEFDCRRIVAGLHRRHLTFPMTGTQTKLTKQGWHRYQELRCDRDTLRDKPND